MHYVVTASLNDGVPQLRVIDLRSGQVRLSWKMEMIQKMFENGEIKREEFLHPEKYGMNLLLKNLFLIACAHDLEHDNCTSGVNNRNSQRTFDDWQFSLNPGPAK